VKILLRVVLTLLLVFVAVRVGFMLAPGLARFGSRGGTTSRSLSPAGVGTLQPDWGGGRLSLRDRPMASVLDSVRRAAGADSAKTRTHASPAGSVLLRQKPDSDYAVTLVMPSSRDPGRSALFELPSASRFRKELLPGEADAEPPAADVPLYPQARCRMQVGRGTSYFVGFYLTSDGVEAVRSFYTSALGRLGWRRVPVSQPGPIETFTKPGKDRSVILQLRRQDSTTTRIGLVATSGSPERIERK